MKKIFILFVICSFLLSSCGYEYEQPQSEQQNSVDDSNIENNENEQIEEEQKEEVISFVHEDIEIVYVGYEKYSDEQIFVYFEMKNNSDEKVTFDYTFEVCAYQNGIELETNYIYDCDEERNGSLEIKPGATIKVAEVFELRSDTDVVEIEIEPFISFTDKILCSFEIELNQ